MRVMKSQTIPGRWYDCPSYQLGLYLIVQEQRVEGIEGKLEALIECFSNRNPPLTPSPTTTFQPRQQYPVGIANTPLM